MRHRGTSISTLHFFSSPYFTFKQETAKIKFIVVCIFFSMVWVGFGQMYVVGLIIWNVLFIWLQLCPGGGFGPVSDKGYGVSYMMAGDSRIFFHVSSKRSCTATDSQGFVNEICRALDDMRMLFLGHDKPLEEPKETADIIKQTSEKLDKDTSNHVQLNGVNGVVHWAQMKCIVGNIY